MPLRRTDTKRLLCVYSVLVAAALAGCAVGPDFRRPAPPAVSSYTADALPGETVEAKVAGGGTQRFVSGEDIPPLWWALFRSEALDQLIRQALKDSPTLSAAQATLRVAEENRRAQFGALFPQVDANASASRQQVSGESFGQTGNTNPTFTLYNASVNVSYDLDLFGGTRRAVEAAGAEVDFQRFQLEGAWLTLTSNLVVTAMQEASLRAQIRATREILTAEEQQLALVERQLQLGGTALVEVLPQRAQVAQTRVLLPALEKRLAQTRHLLAILAGRFPADAADLPEFELEGLQLPGELPVSLPSSLARQRPDILAAEALLHAASARIGVATANLYPQLTLTGSFGSQALQASDLFASGTSFWNLGAGVLQPLFRGGELTAKRRAAIAAYDQAVAQYRETVLQAFREVADVLKALESDAVTLKAQADAEAAARESLDLAQKQFRYGASSYLSLLNAQRQYLLARIGLVQVQTLRYSDTAALFQALGGGWWNRKPEGGMKSTSRERPENPDTGVVRP
jgi:NodT family efflux transporter outer membrane factor (OMF) lipoprotein